MKRAIAVFLDLTKAHPRNSRVILGVKLQNLKSPETVLSELKGLHEQTQYWVKKCEGMSELLTPQRGLREGCTTSTIHFNI